VTAADIQTMSYIISSCPLTKLNDSLRRLHTADEAAINWLMLYIVKFRLLFTVPNLMHVSYEQ